MDWTDYSGALFDLDGVLTPTAVIHRKAWSEMFNSFLAEHPGARAYTDEDYFQFVDGKPRYDGVRAVLADRGIAIDEGSPDDPPQAQTICGLGNRKNDAFVEILSRDGIGPYQGSQRLVDWLAAQRIEMGVVSSSLNAEAVLRASGLRSRFDVVVDGVVAAAEGLAGKPAPDTYLRGAQLLGLEPSRCVVFEDAVSGVAAGAAGHFGLVVGVDRGVGRDRLLASGADIVVDDLEEVIK
ncbi:beta-phosphoglucomutase family hydrolase [Acidipropionibacterium jensenii]|uniref:HAD family hydrolase n=1 Tax=Acidipropionibacterium jensenii TaxID=1749 RepID=UPI00110AADE6|nr:beta-phosphoglucomutase family hydrolase [Acidipropionibacterium jensenii]QCV88967.1 beta-phosphoglucomutase family hydrolase [Acidipropionibacterium jensenii]